MGLNIAEVENLAQLVRLTLTSEEKEKYAQQLSSILDVFEIINRLPTENVEPLIHIHPLVNVMRDDVISPSLSPEEVMGNAPLQEDGQFKVPRII